MINDFQNILVFEISLREVVANMLLALVFGIFISILYRWTNRRQDYSPTFANSLILLSMITAMAIMIIGNSLARAFGMVGLLSILRFRTATRDSKEFMYIFFTLAAGLAAGVGSFSVAIFCTLFIGSIIIILHLRKARRPGEDRYTIRVFWSGEQVQYSEILNILNRASHNVRMKDFRSQGKESLEFNEYLFVLSLPNNISLTELAGELRKMNGIRKVEINREEYEGFF